MPGPLPHRECALRGALLGCALGDAVGLPLEGLSPRRAQRFIGKRLHMRFLPGIGMVSDDTDHTIFVAQSLMVGDGDVSRFRRALAWRLRCWLLCLPAGIGLATLRAILRLWLGMSRSGVFSAGNGPAMRSAVIGAALAEDAAARRAHVQASTELTHTDPRAFTGALALAEIAACLARGEWRGRPTTGALHDLLAGLSPEAEWQQVVTDLTRFAAHPDPHAAAARFGRRGGISGYVYHSVPFAILAWYWHYGDFRATLECVARAGGDVDTVGAMAGALAGVVTGEDGLPRDWLDGLIDWPHGRACLRALAAGLADPARSAPTAFSPWLFPRGLLFMLLVLLHGFRRLLPPY